MEQWTGRVALVTGASSGIGAGVTCALVRAGLKVVGCGREVGRIEALKASLESAPGDLMAIRCDLRSEKDITDMFEAIQERWGGVDICINNAGVATLCSLMNGPISDFRLMADVNFLAPAICTTKTIQSIRKRGLDDGLILNINSVAGHAVMPGGTLYSASKFAVTALTEGLRHELANEKSNIRACQICPGVVNTEMGVRMTSPEAQKEFLAAHAHLQVEDVVRAVMFVLSSPKNVQVQDIIIRAQNGHV